MTHKKNRNTLLYLLINYISSRSASQILSLKDEYIFGFSNFLITGLCKSSANYWFVIFLLLIADLSTSVTALPEYFLSKNV